VQILRALPQATSIDDYEKLAALLVAKPALH
jgi:hypothetical protein